MSQSVDLEDHRLLEKRNEKNVKYMQQTMLILPSVVLSLDSSKYLIYEKNYSKFTSFSLKIKIKISICLALLSKQSYEHLVDIHILGVMMIDLFDLLLFKIVT